MEGYLFFICAYKLTDVLRREGRRPAIAISQKPPPTPPVHPGKLFRPVARGASSIARSGERRQLEEKAIIEALQNQILKWQERGDWAKLKCIELLFVLGLGNKEVADELNLTEQQVANFKFDFLARTKALVGRQNLDNEVFPELAE